jgi:hypothetical protein
MIIKLKVLFRLLVTRHRTGFSSFSERLAFYLQINPVFNLLFALWFGSISSRQSLAGRLSRWLVHRGFGYGALRHLSPEGRIRFASTVLDATRARPDGGTERIRAIANEIRETGFARIPGFLPLDVVEQAREHFARCDHFNAQIYTQSDGIPVRKDWRTYTTGSADRYICFKKTDSLAFLRQGNGVDLDYLKRVADAYCGFDSYLYGMNTMGTFPGEGEGYVMRPHRDYDDFNCLTIFIPWTKTTEDDGATLYVPGSHKSSDAGTRMIALDAEPGDLVAVDTFGLHAGNKQVKRPRLVTWIRFGHKTNLATIQDGV